VPPRPKGWTMMLEGLRLMALGMTMVFVFLTLLVLLMHGSARFLRAFAQRFPEPALERPAPRGPAAAPAAADDGARSAVVMAAIHRHRARRT
jgi:oxaloacetate decarboxylase (Na+ extruding) subunit gamma